MDGMVDRTKRFPRTPRPTFDEQGWEIVSEEAGFERRAPEDLARAIPRGFVVTLVARLADFESGGDRSTTRLVPFNVVVEARSLQGDYMGSVVRPPIPARMPKAGASSDSEASNVPAELLTWQPLWFDWFEVAEIQDDPRFRWMQLLPAELRAQVPVRDLALPSGPTHVHDEDQVFARFHIPLIDEARRECRREGIDPGPFVYYVIARDDGAADGTGNVLAWHCEPNLAFEPGLFTVNLRWLETLTCESEPGSAATMRRMENGTSVERDEDWKPCRLKGAIERAKPAPVPSITRPTGPNDPCRCGSGKKHKRCCGGEAT